ncbi:MAG: EamA family transporter [Patescibacteria group bacterium]|nr:EamA family transporter [Patescibacteria group bacterium]
MTPLFYATVIISTSLLWGVGYLMMKKGYRELSTWQTYAVDTFFVAIPLWFLYGLINGKGLYDITWPAITVALITSVLWALYYFTINIGPLSLTSTVLSASPIFSIVLARYILQEKLNLFVLLTILLSLLGILMTGFEKPKGKFHFASWFYIAIFYAVSYGLVGVLQKFSLQTTSNTTFMILLAIGQLVTTIVWKMVKQEKLPPLKFRIVGLTITGLFFVSVADIIYFYSLEKGLASIIIPLSETYVIVLTVLSAIFLKEKIKLYQWLGITLVVFGVILTNILLGNSQTINLYASTIKTVNLDSPIKLPNIVRNHSSPNTTSSMQTSNIPLPPTDSLVANVTYVYDGDSIKLSDGNKLRYLGIDTPELGKNGNNDKCFAKEAANINKQLVLGQTIKIEKDISQSDKYGRLLRYIWVDNVFVNDFLIRQGFARLETIPPDTKYAAEFAGAEAEAKENKRGLWKVCY